MAQCRACNGAGDRLNPLWSQYHEAVWNGEFNGDDVPAALRFFQDHGCDTFPPTKIPCPDCHGAGHRVADTSEQQASGACFLSR